MNRKVFFIIMVFLILTPSVHAHEGEIIDGKNNKSPKISYCDNNYYGYHKDDEDYHFHKVLWNKDISSWQIVDEEIFMNSPCSVKNGKKYPVKLSACVDGDTVKFVLSKEIVTVRLLAVDTPELNHSNERVKKFADLAKEFTCDFLKKAKNIEIEYDERSKKTDRYNRHLVWVFTEEGLLQEELIKERYAKVEYLYDRYKYTSKLQVIEEETSKTNKGVWQFKVEDFEDLVGSPMTRELTDKERIEKIIYVVLVVVITAVTIIREIAKKD